MRIGERRLTWADRLAYALCFALWLFLAFFVAAEHSSYVTRALNGLSSSVGAVR